MKKTFKHAKFTATFTDNKGYFSLTGECDGASGAVGESIVKIDNRFALLHAMHLSNTKSGEPMHAIANAIYYAEEGNAETLAAHLRCTPEFAQELCAKAKFKNYDLEMIIARAGTWDQWKAEAKAVYALVEKIPANLCKGFVDPYDTDGNPISEEYETFLDGLDEPERAIAAAMQEDIDVLEVAEDRTMYTAAGREYVVLTDDEADDAWDAELESYIDDCLEIPESIEPYFDREAWKRDARMDGRGHSLSRYDGNEYEQTVNGTTYYLYRQ